MACMKAQQTWGVFVLHVGLNEIQIRNAWPYKVRQIGYATLSNASAQTWGKIDLCHCANMVLFTTTHKCQSMVASLASNKDTQQLNTRTTSKL